MINEHWLEKYNMVKNYYEKYGNTLIPGNFKTKDGINYDENGYILGNWIIEQRRYYNSNKLPKDKIELLNQIEMIWYVKDYVWNQNYTLARNYYNKYNNLNVPIDFKTKDGITYDEKGFGLGHWIIDLKQQYNNTKVNRLTEEQIKKLEDIGMIWSVYNHNWKKHYEIAKKYYEHNGNLSIPYNFKTKDGINYDENGFNLHGWCVMQKNAYKGVGTNRITQEQIKKLEDIGIIWYPREYNWETNYNEVLEYLNKYNNLSIPLDYKTKNGIELGRWLDLQKKMYRDNKLSDERIKLFEKIGIIWDSISDIKWMKNYNLAKKYYEKYGNLSIATDFKTKDGITYDENGTKLGYWIVSQRRIYRKGKNGNLDDNRINLLNEIGMLWKVNLSKKSRLIINSKWDKCYNLAKNYYEKYGNLDIPYNFKTSDGITFDLNGVKLGKWINVQRQVFKGKVNYNIIDEHIELLDKIGMIWFINNSNEKSQFELITNKNIKRKEIELLNRFKSYLLSLEQSNLPSKEEINNNFVKYLEKH